MVIYSLSDKTLLKQATYRTATAPIDIALRGNTIAIADLMKSVSIIDYKRGTAGLPDTLDEVARHYQTVWSTAVADIADDTFLESDAEGNLMILNQNINGVTASDRSRLEVTSEIRLGEMVNRIRSFEVPFNPNAIVVPTAFIGTVSPPSLLPHVYNMIDTLRRSKAPSTSSPSSPPPTSTPSCASSPHSLRSSNHPAGSPSTPTAHSRAERGRRRNRFDS